MSTGARVVGVGTAGGGDAHLVAQGSVSIAVQVSEEPEPGVHGAFGPRGSVELETSFPLFLGPAKIWFCSCVIGPVIGAITYISVRAPPALNRLEHARRVFQLDRPCLSTCAVRETRSDHRTTSPTHATDVAPNTRTNAGHRRAGPQSRGPESHGRRRPGGRVVQRLHRRPPRRKRVHVVRHARDTMAHRPDGMRLAPGQGRSRCEFSPGPPVDLGRQRGVRQAIHRRERHRGGVPRGTKVPRGLPRQVRTYGR